MSYKIKFRFFQTLFRLFAYMADKTGGWKMFVRPKLLLGSIMIGLGVTACGTKTSDTKMSTNEVEKPDSTAQNISAQNDSSSNPSNNVDSSIRRTVTCYFIPPVIEKKKSSSKIKVQEEQVQVMCYKPTSETIALSIDSNQVYNHVEVMPQFPGGDSKLIKWLSENTHYPKNTQDKGIEGRVVCRFVVEEDGTISDIEIVKSLAHDFDKEAVQIIKSMPKWIPGKQNGKAVRVYYNLPILFRLPK